MPFDRIVIIDWSAASAPSPARPSPDAIWLAEISAENQSTRYHRTRAAAAADLQTLCDQAITSGERLLIGADFPFGFPTGLAAAITGQGGAMALWDWLRRNVEDGPDNSNNRFALAAAMNAQLPGIGPFWGRPATLDLPDLPERGAMRNGHGLPERRLVEEHVPRAQTCWKLYTTGAVGSQALLGIPMLARLRQRFAGHVGVWPFEPASAPVVLAEVYPSLLAGAVAAEQARDPASIRDEVQVRLLARALWQQGEGLEALFRPPVQSARLAEEGWILGVGHQQALERALLPSLEPPRLSNDCFALPPGVDWTPVDVALGLLRQRLHPITGAQSLPATEALGRVLATDAVTSRANPPAANAAVDGYGFAHSCLVGDGPYHLPLHPGRAAAGAPFAGALPAGRALRILTGAILPDGVDTVVLEEDTATDGAHIAFHGPVKARANTRRAGEDLPQGTVALAAGHVIAAPDLALLAATGISAVQVRQRLRVGVLSTGDEIEPDPRRVIKQPHRLYDANRPMLLALAQRWGHCPVDLGHVPDDRGALRRRLDAARLQADVVLTSGGASAGDEDHVSALLRAEGKLSSWRIAMKPGRPLALAMWGDMPVFGLPGNPVAAFVCALIFARPALSLLAGAGWLEPLGFDVPAAFEKRKKAGRREYLRARLTSHGHAEVFASEGSGRISGLSWARGLVELGDDARHVRPGDPVRYYPYAGFGV
ncbi:molybdopterin-binding protein [Plastorhodobacter daqingensis]|uniref:Molybdopterin molybdenumtransferase n=1 Tax=Plastorhodobacter daqingensis TaxID=1387281 RepID=A0ABW2UN03_9RHOB